MPTDTAVNVCDADEFIPYLNYPCIPCVLGWLIRLIKYQFSEDLYAVYQSLVVVYL